MPLMLGTSRIIRVPGGCWCVFALVSHCRLPQFPKHFFSTHQNTESFQKSDGGTGPPPLDKGLVPGSCPHPVLSPLVLRLASWFRYVSCSASPQSSPTRLSLLFLTAIETLCPDTLSEVSQLTLEVLCIFRKAQHKPVLTG